MNILLVYHELGFRGGEKLFASFAKGLIAKRHKVFLVIGRSSIDSINFPKEVNIIKPPKLLNIIFRNNLLFIFFSIPVTFLNILLNSSKFDVIYCGESFTALWPAILASILLKKKLVLSVFELGKEKINTLLLKKIKYATSLNSSLITSLKNIGIKNVYFIPIGIDFDYLKKPEPQRVINKYNLKNKKVILMPGTIHPSKRQDLAIEAFHLARKKIPNLALIIVGGGDRNYLNKIKKHGVIFTGFVPEKDVKNYYAACDVCLMCGPIGGITIIEALYMGKNIIYPTSGTPPLGPVEEFGLGIVLKEKSAQAFATKLIDILINPEKSKEKLAKDRKRVIKRFSINEFTSETLKILNL